MRRDTTDRLRFKPKTTRSTRGSMWPWAAAGLGLAAGVYGAYAGVTWSRYGRALPPTPEEDDALLNGFMPTYDVVERHNIAVAAPAAVTLAVAREVDLFDNAVVRAVIKARELLLGAESAPRPQLHGFVAEMQSMGWVILAETPDGIVGGAVTRPWEANVRFRSIPPEQFAHFEEPDYVKIAWTLRADATSETTSIFRTETRALATDRSARAKFRRYWSFIAPGTFLIRRMMLGPIKAEAERQTLYRGS
jgi:hypothetical protein